jgi:mono/diheme cytochrome c family protein
MIKLPTPIRPLLVLAAMAAVALGASACGTTTADVENGRVLFIEKCGTCHTLAEAGTTAQVGPDLDDAFRAAREAGEGGETIEGVVEAQVEFPRPSNSDPSISMPADVVEGQELEDVAAYVGTWAGVPGAAPPKVPGGPGAQVFANNGCGGCHTLAAAQTGGTVGPDLDEVLSGQSSAMIHEDIVDPNKTIAQGYPPSVMPLNFEETLSPEELEDLVQYLVESTGGEGAAPQGGKGGGSKSKGG